MRRMEFCEKVITYKYSLFIVAYAVLQNEADAQDAVCSAILKAYEHLDQLKDVRKFKAWIIAITKNEALQMKRKRLELPGDEKVEALLGSVQDHYNELWDVVQSLKEEFRLVIVLFYYDNLSLRDIARVLDIPIGTVKSRLNRGRELIKTSLEGKEEQV